jgi:ABC-type lipopolysaccharide export system ATPase subunit
MPDIKVKTRVGAVAKITGENETEEKSAKKIENSLEEFKLEERHSEIATEAPR